MLEDYMRKASLKCPGDGKFVSLHEKYVNLFKDLISFKDDGNEDNVGDDDDENGDDDDGYVDNDANDGDGNGDKEDVNQGDKDPNGSNPSFSFSKICLEDFGNDRGLPEKDKVVEGNPTEQGTVVEGNQAEECEIMSTPENFTQWLDKNMDLVGEGDLFGDNSATLEAMNQEITHEKLPTQKAKSHEILSAHFRKFIVYGVRLNLESLALGLWLDANVIDCWGTVLNHEESFQAAESKSKHFFPTGCIFEGNKGGLALGGIDLSEHFYVVVFSLTKTTAMTILVNSPGTYDSKYKEVCDILVRKLFARHLKQYGHIRHTQVARVKHTIPKLKWKTKENFHDCGIFTMLHMETFDGGPASNLDCGLPVESQLQRDMLRRLRFKFATKILLHEINVHARKMLELAKEFDKTSGIIKEDAEATKIQVESHEIKVEYQDI
ncbi:ulp1 protease family, C-terminal catalytic domain-containing protein [Tanacetum coccineum]